MKSLILFLTLLPLLNGCIDCGPQTEPILNVFMHGDSLKLKHVTAIGAVNQDVLKNNQFSSGSDSLSKTSWAFQLPASLQADSTAYIFEFESRTDTLTVYYHREFYHKDGCGFVVDLVKPVNPTRKEFTFSNVRVSYSSYIGTIKSITSSNAGSIVVNITI